MTFGLKGPKLSSRPVYCSRIYSSFTKRSHNSDYCLSLTQDSQSESNSESVNFIEKSDPIVERDNYDEENGDGKPYECALCSATFTQKGNLTRHIEAVHDRKQPFSCSPCGRNFSQKVNMLNHRCTGSANEDSIEEEGKVLNLLLFFDLIFF